MSVLKSRNDLNVLAGYEQREILEDAANLLVPNSRDMAEIAMGNEGLKYQYRRDAVRRHILKAFQEQKYVLDGFASDIADYVIENWAEVFKDEDRTFRRRGFKIKLSLHEKDD